MIEGLKIRVESSELKQHCSERAKYHRERADQKELELPGLKDALAKVEAVTGQNISPASLSHMNKTSGYQMDVDEPVEKLESDIRDHRNKSLIFSFYSEHLFDEVYVLKEDDLVRLEILKRW